MRSSKLTPMELEIMKVLWDRGPSSIPEILERLGKAGGPAYTTVQTLVYRLERKKAIRRASEKIVNANVFEPRISQTAVEGSMIDDLVRLLGGRALPIMTHLIDSGKLTRAEIREAQQALRGHPVKESKP